MERGKLVVLYGSQTGTAQDLAERIWREAKQFGLNGPVKCMDDYSIQNLIYENLVVFVCATTGQGEEPDNMKKFWRFLLRKNLPNDSLKTVKYAVLGLGDSSYVKFNYAAKRLARRLNDLGGTPLIDVGLADDQHDLGIEAVADPWIENLWVSVGSLYKFSPDLKNLNNLPVPRWTAEKVGTVTDKCPGKKLGPDGNKEYSQRCPCPFTVTGNERTTSKSHFQDVRLITLKIPNDLSYDPGDVLMLVPQNGCEKVEDFFQTLNDGRQCSQILNCNDLIQVKARDKDLPVPEALREPISLWECAKKYWDLNAVPRRYTFLVLSHLTPSELEKEKLTEFAEVQGQEELYNYCNRPKRNILEVLKDFPEATRNLTLDFLFEILQPIRPRAFSIASSIKAHPREIHILLAVVEYKTKLLKPRFGLCSRFLADLCEGTCVHGWVRKGSFLFPPPETPSIMVGPGTGVAPFRSYINEVAACGKATSENLVLFFGCRNKEADYHCKKEWEELERKKFVTIFCAFSRDQKDKLYVQHVIVKQGALVWDMLKNRKASIFVAGSSKNMPQSVRESFIKIAQEHGCLTAQEAECFIVNLENSGKYQTETWG